MTGTGKLLHQVSHKILLYRPILQLFQNFVTSLLLGWRTVLPHVGEEHGIIRESQMSVHLREILPAGFYQSVEITRTASLYHIPERIQFRHPGCIQILLNGSPFPGCQILFFKRRPAQVLRIATHQQVIHRLFAHRLLITRTVGQKISVNIRTDSIQR